MNTAKFINFLESIHTEQNESTLDCIFEGFTAILEYPHVTLNNKDLDLKVENKSPEKRMAYVDKLIHLLEQHPSLPAELTDLLIQLKKLKEYITK